eukprot:scaffold10436_cov107-Amphora_coffeaeformis.AAC.1
MPPKNSSKSASFYNAWRNPVAATRNPKPCFGETLNSDLQSLILGGIAICALCVYDGLERGS